MKLIFCDTFSQDPSDGSVVNRWSVIDFPNPVVLEEIRVLSNGVRLHEQLGADGQIGKTSPRQFRIDFFASDANNNTSSTFENLCSLEYQEGVHSSVLPRLPFVTDKLVCSGCYQMVSLAVFGAEASDMDGVRAIRERREMDASARPRALLPTPSDGFHDTDARLPTPRGDREVQPKNMQPFPGYQREPQSHLGPSAPQYQEPNDANSKYPLQQNFQKPFNERNFRSREQDESQFRRDRVEPPSKRFPLLPTPAPNLSGEARDEQQQHAGRFPDDGFSRSHPRFGVQDNQREWHGNRRTLRSPDYLDAGQRDTDGNASRPGDAGSDHEALSNYPLEQHDEEEWADAEYEEISDEEIMDEEAANNMDEMVAEDMLLPTSMMSFNPFEMIPYPLTYYKPPDVTDYESLRIKLQNENVSDYVDPKTVQEVSQANKKLQRLISHGLKHFPVPEPNAFDLSCSDVQGNMPDVLPGKEEEWVSTMEKIAAEVTTSLPHLHVTSEEESQYYTIVAVWAVKSLCIDGPFAKIIGLNVRALKSGLNLASKLCQTTGELAEQLVHVGLAEAVLRILQKPHMASSIKICGVHVLDAMTDWPDLMHRFLFGGESAQHDPVDAPTPNTLYVKVVELALLPQAARVSAAITQLLRKAHVYECMHQVKTSTRVMVESVPDEYAYVMDDDDDMEEDYLPDEEVEMVVMSSASGDDDEDQERLPPEEAAQNKALSDLRIVHESGQRKVFGVGADESTTPADPTYEAGNNGKPGEYRLDDLNFIPMESVFNVADVNVTEESVVQLADCLDEISNALKRPQSLVGQLAIRMFPASGSSLPEESDDSRPCIALFRMSESTNLISSVQALLSLPVVSGHKLLFGACCRLLFQLMSTQAGLLHLVANSDSIVHVIRHLLKAAPRLDIHLPGTAGYLGVQLAFHVQCMQSIDHIQSLLASDADEEDVEEELVHAFRTLFSLTYIPFGRHCVAKVLSMADHFNPILTCLWFPRKLIDFVPVPPSQEKSSEKDGDDKKSDSGSKAEESSDAKEDEQPVAIQHRTAVNQYAAAILLTALLGSEDVGFLFKHAADLRRSCLSEMHSIPQADMIRNWLHPLKLDLNGEVCDIEPLVTFVKSELEHLEWSSMLETGAKLCTSARLLCHLCNTGDAEDLLCGDSRLPIMRMFSANGLNVLLSLMERLHASLQHVCHGVRSMSGCLCASVHSTVVSLTRSCVFLLLHMLGQLVDANIDSKAISGERIAQVAVALYSDIYIMLRPTDPFLLDDLTSKFVSILSLFFMHDCCADLTAPVLTGLVNHAESHCDCFVPTLTLLSQLLPIPLPIVSEEEPGEDAKAAVTAVCKRWADYLTPHVDRVLSLLLPLSSSSCRPVLNVCVALCQQMIDLSPDTALAIAKKYKDQIAPLLVNTGAEDQDGDDAAADESSGEKGLVLSPEQVTTIENFAEIITLPSAKAAFISSIHEEGEGMLDLWQYASSSLSPKEAVAEVLLLASVMIDADISLRSEVSSPSDIFPPAMHLRQIAILATQQLTNSSEIVYCRALLVISHFLQSSSTAIFARNALVRRGPNLVECLERLVQDFDRTNSYCVGAAVNLAEVLFMLSAPDQAEDESASTDANRPGRPYLSQAQLAALLKWDGGDAHALLGLESALSKAFDEETDCSSDIEFALDGLVALRQSLALHCSSSPADTDIVNETELPAPAPLAEQFARRPLFVFGEEDEVFNIRLALFWDRQIRTKDNFVQCDLVATAEKFCPGFDLADQLGKLAKAFDISCDSVEADSVKSRRPAKVEAFSCGRGKKATYMKRSHGLLMTQPRVGRGRGRMSATNRPHDLFRHRKQNTSRPPSMHVDDFMAADEEEQQKSGDEMLPFKSPPLPPVALPSQRRPPMQQGFKRTFTPRGRARGRGAGFGRPGRFGSSYGSAGSALHRFKSKLNSPIRGRVQDRFRGSAGSLSSRLSFSPREGFKTIKNESWNGPPRNFTPGGSQSPSGRGRGSKTGKYPRAFPQDSYSSSSRGKQWTPGSQFQRRGRGYPKTRGKHFRSYTR